MRYESASTERQIVDEQLARRLSVGEDLSNDDKRRRDRDLFQSSTSTRLQRHQRI